jgi:D-glycero-alpha-D-manno-heptose 1-phosphate guanylyltransferase
MEAIILAGGKGTRLKSVIKDIPKPMAPLQDRPFLSFILDELSAQGFEHAVLSTGYKHGVIQDYFGDQYLDMKISYSQETSPLGTGGAIRQALTAAREDNVFVLNGDTMFRVDFRDMLRFHQEQQSGMTVALKKMEDSSRYGTVETAEGKLVDFGEKKANSGGLINGGIYLIGQQLFPVLAEMPERFSFEKDFMEVFFRKMPIMAYPSDAYFIDIGIPEDYRRAHQELTNES